LRRSVNIVECQRRRQLFHAWSQVLTIKLRQESRHRRQCHQIVLRWWQYVLHQDRARMYLKRVVDRLSLWKGTRERERDTVSKRQGQYIDIYDMTREYSIVNHIRLGSMDYLESLAQEKTYTWALR
jgi:hypothetical protein